MVTAPVSPPVRVDLPPPSAPCAYVRTAAPLRTVEIPARVNGLVLTTVVALHVAGVALLLRTAEPAFASAAPVALQVSWIAGENPSPSEPSAAAVAPEVTPAPPPPSVRQQRAPHPARIPPPRIQIPKLPVQAAPVLAVEADAPGTENLPVTASAAEPGPQPDSGTGPTADASSSAASASNAGESAGSAESGYVAPNFNANYLSNPRPDYPALSTQLREQGAVKLRVHVTADGHADKVVLHKSSGYGRLDKAALDVVWRWRFKPASRAGTAVAAWVVVPINFHIKS